MKTEFSFKDLYAIRKVNLIPFSESVIINDKIDYTEIYLNVLVFVPFGIYISILKPDWSFIRKVIPIAATSLLFETLQYIFAIGAADITDFLMNTLGGTLGIIADFIARKIFQNEVNTNKIVNILASIASIGFIILAGILFLANV